MGTIRTDDEWRAVIEEQRRSGLNPTHFCRQNAITRSAFSNAVMRFSQNTSPPSAFIPAQPATHGTAVPTPTETIHGSAAGITVELPHCTLRLTQAVSPQWLSTLIRKVTSP